MAHNIMVYQAWGKGVMLLLELIVIKYFIL